MEGLVTPFTERDITRMLAPPCPAEYSAGSHEGLKVSEAEFWDVWYYDPDYRYEWNNGYLEVKPVGDYQGHLMSHWFILLLDNFLKAFPIARSAGLDIGFRLSFSGRVSIRKPDYAVILNTNTTDIQLLDASYRGTYDLCIEFLSYSSRTAIQRDTVQKKKEYAGGGVPEYYILDPRGLQTAFYELDARHRYQPIPPVQGDVIQSRVLPGFQFRISDLYHQPGFKALTDDCVYQQYVMLDYQKQKQRAEQADRRAEQERQRAKQADRRAEQEKRRAEQEKQRADKLEARLKALGLSLDEE